MALDPFEAQDKRIAEEKADAKFVHDLHSKAILSNVPVTVSLGIEALKFAVLVNGGTAGALLAFVSRERLVQQPNVVRALQLFAVGLMLAALASAFAYIAQLYYGNSAREMSVHGNAPFVRDTPESLKSFERAKIAHKASLFLVLISFCIAATAFFFVGKQFNSFLPEMPPVSPR